MEPRRRDSQRQGRRSKWNRENILTAAGLLILAAEWVNAEFFGHTFHYEFLIAGLALCGIGVAQWGDKK